MELNTNEVEKYLKYFEKKILHSKNHYSIELNRDWVVKFPREAGVYAILEGSEVRYVGETGSLRGRMNDLLSTRNHVARRNIGHSKFSAHPKFEKATTRNKFPPEIELKVDTYLKKNFKIAYLEVNMGRKELEEWLIDIHEPIYNKKGKRITKKSRQEKWQDDVNEMKL